MTQPKIEGVGHGVPRMLYANDGSNWYAILVDSDGHVKVDIVAYPGSNALGNFPFGFESVLNDANGTIFAGGSTRAISAAVPTGKVWVITVISVRPITRAATNFMGGVSKDGSSNYLFYDSDGVAQYYISTFYGPLYLDAGDGLFFDVGGGQNGDEVHIIYSGYQMAVA